MPKGIEKSDWDQVHEIACDVVNASAISDEILCQSRTVALLALLEDLRRRYGDHPSILATVGDFLEDEKERMKFYNEGLRIARKQNYVEEIEEILDSIRELEASIADDQEGGRPDGRR